MKRPESSWSLWCDFPGCAYQWEYGDFSIFGDGWEAEEIVRDSDGWLDADGERHYCHRHPAVWQSDLEPPNADSPPAPPYLLIHDGDDHHDDGTAELVATPETPDVSRETSAATPTGDTPCDTASPSA